MPEGTDPLQDEAYVAEVMQLMTEAAASPKVQEYVRSGMVTTEMVARMAAHITAEESGKAEYVNRSYMVGKQVAKILRLNDGEA